VDSSSQPNHELGGSTRHEVREVGGRTGLAAMLVQHHHIRVAAGARGVHELRQHLPAAIDAHGARENQLQLLPCPPRAVVVPPSAFQQNTRGGWEHTASRVAKPQHSVGPMQTLTSHERSHEGTHHHRGYQVSMGCRWWCARRSRLAMTAE
jgi:hypothetical protein